jgi:hypothetical protein
MLNNMQIFCLQTWNFYVSSLDIKVSCYVKWKFRVVRHEIFHVTLHKTSTFHVSGLKLCNIINAIFLRALKCLFCAIESSLLYLTHNFFQCIVYHNVSIGNARQIHALMSSIQCLFAWHKYNTMSAWRIKKNPYLRI